MSLKAIWRSGRGVQMFKGDLAGLEDELTSGLEGSVEKLIQAT